MKELRNNFDKEVVFENLDEAKKYYLPKEDKPCEIEDYLGDNYEKFCIDFNSYKKAIQEAADLEELVDVLNEWSDSFDNGTEYVVFEN